MTLPPDREHVTTEQIHSTITELDLLSTHQCVSQLSEDHLRAVEAVQRSSNQIASFVDALVPKVTANGRLIYIGCGTSGRLGVLDAAECPPTFQSDPAMILGLIAGGDASLRVSSESKEDDPNGAHLELSALQLQPTDTVLGIAAGGTTPWVLGGLEFAKQAGAMTCLLTCSNVTSTMLITSSSLKLDLNH